MGKKVNFIVLGILVIVSLVFGSEYQTIGNLEDINSGDTAWILVASAFVLLMTPGLAFFYGGMVNKKNVISTFSFGGKPSSFKM